MHVETELSFYRFRYVFAGILTVAFLVAISALVTAVGSHSVLDRRSGPVVTIDDSVEYSPNTVTASAGNLAAGTERALLATGTTLYSTCRSITIATTQSGKAVSHAGSVLVQSIGSGVVWAGRSVASSALWTVRSTGSAMAFTVRLPGKMTDSIRGGYAVSSFIRPADDDKTIPVISSEETSAAVLARLSAAQRQQITAWQAAQVAANQGLGGSIFAGDPNHGGYPAKWDTPVAQDSTVDSWGMYNRECVSYAAWKVYQAFGDMPYWGGAGNANQWVSDARRAGIATGRTPQVHAVAISMAGYYGHAMWVEKVSGNMIYVSQYNYDLHGHYSEMWVNGSSFTYIYFK